MKTRKMLTATVTMMLLMLFAMPAGIFAQDEDIWDEPRAQWVRQRRQIDPEMIAQLLDGMAQEDPERARKLEALQKDDPDAFAKEMQSIMQEHMKKRMAQRNQGRDANDSDRRGQNRQGRSSRRTPTGAQPVTRTPGTRTSRRRTPASREEYLNWLSENFPDEAQKLQQMQQRNPGEQGPGGRRMALSMKKYYRAFEASKRNPELGEILKQDITLKDRRRELLRELQKTTDEDAKSALTAELSEVVGQRYNLIVIRKQIAYEELAKKLQELQKELEKNEAEVEKFKDQAFKDKHIKTRVEELTTQTEKLNWEE